MTITQVLLLAALLVALMVGIYIYVGARRLSARRDARVAAETARDGEGVAAAPLAPAPGAMPAAADAALPPEVASPFRDAPDGPADDLTQIKGIGPKLSAMLAELGVFHFHQIAAWTPEQLAAVDARLGPFQGRPERDQWQAQARLLASGDRKAFERAHGKLGTASPASPDGDATGKPA